MANKMIERLKLNWAFRGHAVSPDDCLSLSTSAVLYVKDDEVTKVSAFVPLNGDDGECLVVLNEDEKEIGLLSIDNRLMKNVRGGIADCAVMNAARLWLVEFKTNAEGNTDEAIKATYNKAMDQLLHTIHIFTEKTAKIGVDFVGTTDLHCDVVTAQCFPATSAMNMNFCMEFADKSGGVPLDMKRRIHL